jgi:hypothetical protein
VSASAHESHRVRRGGRFEDEAGRFVTWSVASGSRGRRWRWVIADPGHGVLVSHTLETGGDGRFQKVESAAGRGLLTLHLERDGRLHGHRVVGNGVEHLQLDVPVPALVLVGWDAVGGSALSGALGPIAETARFGIAVVSDGLGIEVRQLGASPVGRRSIELEMDGRTLRVDVDGDGLPVVAGGDTWPLERGEGAG